MSAENLEFVEIFAGNRPDGQPVAERMPVKILEDGNFQLLRSPAFIKGIAAGDVIKLEEGEHSFALVKHSGNLCLRVMAKDGVQALAEDLTPELEILGGQLDFENERVLVYTIHVSCGFATIEKILNDHVGDATDSVWYYGNVYDPDDGVTPLNWWQEILKPQ